jgi:hypothetical protein
MAITNQSRQASEYPIETEDEVSLLCEDGAELLIEKSSQEMTNASKPA